MAVKKNKLLGGQLGGQLGGLLLVPKVGRGGQILWYPEVTFHVRRRGGRAGAAAAGGGGWVVRVDWQKEGVFRGDLSLEADRS